MDHFFDVLDEFNYDGWLDSFDEKQIDEILTDFCNDFNYNGQEEEDKDTETEAKFEDEGCGGNHGRGKTLRVLCDMYKKNYMDDLEDRLQAAEKKEEMLNKMKNEVVGDDLLPFKKRKKVQQESECNKRSKSKKLQPHIWMKPSDGESDSSTGSN